MPKRIGRYLMVEQIYVEQRDRPAGHKTDKWSVLTNDGGLMGEVEWYGPWRQYTFNPFPGTTFNTTCLMDLTMFLGEQNKAQRAARSV